MRFIEQFVATGGLCALLFTIGCDSVGGLLVEDRGKTPSAVARVLGQSSDGGTVKVDFAGQPVAVTLDGTQSSDPDGPTASYRWLGWTGAVADGGTVWSPTDADGASPGWPDDVAQPIVTLGEGTYVFTLWVSDDRGNTSEPDSVRVEVKPAQTCVESADDVADPVCVACLCNVSPACSVAVSASQCDAACWGLIGCIGEMCPDPQTLMACVPANCGQFLPPTAPMSALDGARALGPMGGDCFAPCGEDCPSMPSMP